MNTPKKNITDFELQSYIREVYNEVQALTYADADGDSKENKFTEFVIETLMEAGETEGARLCYYEKENKNENIDMKINGYALEDGYENIDIFITTYRDTTDNYRLTKADFEKRIRWSTKFVNSAIKGYLEDIEPSTEAYGLAKLLLKERKNIVRVNIFILANGDVPHDPPTKFKLKNLEEILINFKIWDIERLHRLSQSSGNREPIEIDFEELMDAEIPCLEMPSKNDLYECYLAIVPGTVLATLYRNYGTRLLESNVRAFLQQTGKINRGIRDTIRHEPQMFLPYNNGLATTALEVRTKQGKNGQKVITFVKDFQIVNGGQTTASLFHTNKKYKEADISEVFVQMKLTVIKDEEKKNATVPFISRYANSQNKVSELDLTSNNPFLQRLEELSRTTYAIDPFDRNKQSIWFFERVKGQYKEALNKEPTKSKQNAFKLKYPRNQLIIKSEIAKYLNLWNQLPFHVSKGSQKNYNQFLKGIEKIFKKKKPGRIYWEDVVANAILFRATDKLFGRKNQNPVGDTNIKSHTVSYALGYFHFITKNRLNLGTIWKQQFIEEELQMELKKLLVFVYNFLNSLNVALVSEAAKSEKTWNQLKEISNHPLDLSVVGKYLISEADFKVRYESDIDEVEENKKIDTLGKINALGLRFWDGLCLYIIQESCLTRVQENYVSTIRKKIQQGGSFLEKEIQRGGQIIDSLQRQNIDFEKIKVLSQIDEKEIINPAVIYNRLKSIDTETWKKAIALGQQTGRMSAKEVSVLTTVMKRIKKKENIDLNRLQITEAALNKVRKFGLNL